MLGRGCTLYYLFTVCGWILQEKSAFFFCLEDRALLCRDCDVSIHSATALSSAHQRFLVPGTRVALEALSNSSPAPQETATSEELARHPLSSIINGTATNSSKSPSVSYKQSSYYTPTPSFTSPSSGKTSVITSNKSVGMSNTSASHQSVSSTQAKRTSITEFLSDAIPNWRVDELLNIPELGEGYSLGDIASSKVVDIDNGSVCMSAVIEVLPSLGENCFARAALVCVVSLALCSFYLPCFWTRPIKRTSEITIGLQI